MFKYLAALLLHSIVVVLSVWVLRFLFCALNHFIIVILISFLYFNIFLLCIFLIFTVVIDCLFIYVYFIPYCFILITCLYHIVDFFMTFIFYLFFTDVIGSLSYSMYTLSFIALFWSHLWIIIAEFFVILIFFLYIYIFLYRCDWLLIHFCIPYPLLLDVDHICGSYYLTFSWFCFSCFHDVVAFVWSPVYTVMMIVPIIISCEGTRPVSPSFHLVNIIMFKFYTCHF